MKGIRIIHDSHNLYFRKPFGALPCGEKVKLRLLVESATPLQEVHLNLARDGEEARTVKMSLQRQEGSLKEYVASVQAPPEPGLLWYYFSLQDEGEKLYYYGNLSGQGGAGGISEHLPQAYQITVYRQGTSTPSWFKRAVIYQIFVDRFYDGYPKRIVPQAKKGSLLHMSWDDDPFYIRDPQTGKVLRWDFFGGNLLGVHKKLGYLKKLGIDTIYFNPIFTSPSNHKYDTADYHNLDPMFGDNHLFETLAEEAARLGIRIILDGVFSHTGSDSIYFNREGAYPSLGAWQSLDSPYARWYFFEHYPDRYRTWWGIETLPEVNELEPSYLDFVIRGEESVLHTWMRRGAKGWRLDVADELPDPFIRYFLQEMRRLDPESVLIGEVWEDASNKISYDTRRHYFSGDELDSVMNYPFRQLALDFARGMKTAYELHRGLLTLYENYPLPYFYSTMNLLGSHDVARLLTELQEHLPVLPSHELVGALGGMSTGVTDGRAIARKRLKLLILLQMTFPGVPSVYYGDEAGLEGGVDPMNRKPYPWDREDQEMINGYRNLIALRKTYPVFATGEWFPFALSDDIYGYIRLIRNGTDSFGEKEEDNLAVALFNRNPYFPKECQLELTQWMEPWVRNELEEEAEEDLQAGTEKDLDKKVSQEKHQEEACERKGLVGEGAGQESGENGELAGNEERFLMYDCLAGEHALVQDRKLALRLDPLSGRVLVKNRWPKNRQRKSGLLLHLTSLPSPYGAGDLGPEAYAFLSFLQKSGQRLWQVLPIHPPGYGGSPFQSDSAFAGNTWMISPDLLAEEGLLTEEELSVAQEQLAGRLQEQQIRDQQELRNRDNMETSPFNQTDLFAAHAAAEFSVTRQERGKRVKEDLFWKAFERFLRAPRIASEFEQFCKQHRDWLEDYALYRALKDHFHGRPWYLWSRRLIERQANSLSSYRRKLETFVTYHKFLQFQFFRQWDRLKDTAHERGIEIIGDIPIFVSHDSCDVWVNPHLFKLDHTFMPEKVAGVPPDYFSKTGQRWGNPVYRWEKMKEDDYLWWQRRISYLRQRVDYIRIDHFRGFAAAWEIPAKEPDAVTGEWVKGPGEDFFETLEGHLGKLPIIAEDLGVITPDVEDMKARMGYPGMMVMQFMMAADFNARLHIPVYAHNSVLYTGTHDNDTIVSWYRHQNNLERVENQQIAKQFIELAMASDANTVVIPLQDVLALGSEARMNTPATTEGNWLWQFDKGMLKADHARWLLQLVRQTERLPHT